MAESRETNVSKRKLGLVQSASFDTIIAAVTGKSEKAQCTFMHRLIKMMPENVLWASHQYITEAIKRIGKKKAKEGYALTT